MKVTASPGLTTAISAQKVTPGAQIHDNVTLSGLGGLDVRVQVELWGPFATREEIDCAGTAYWTGSFVARGDGTYPTAPVRVDRAGYYSYRERIAPGPSNVGVIAVFEALLESGCSLELDSFAWRKDNPTVRGPSELRVRALPRKA